MKNNKIVAIINATFLFLSLVFLPLNTRGDYQTDPIVPMDVAQRGRQAIVSYLATQVDHVLITFKGMSIAQEQSIYVSNEQLKKFGYVHDGSFSELFNVTSEVMFHGEILKTPQGYYDLQVETSYFTADGRIALTGSGNADIPNIGELPEEITFNPYVWVGSYILAKPSQLINGAQWVSSSWSRSPQQLGLIYLDDNSPYIRVPISVIDDGMIIVSSHDGESQKLHGYDLKNGNVLRGKSVVAWLGRSQSGDVNIVVDSKVSLSKDLTAYLSDGVYYTRIPLTELKLSKSRNEMILPSIKAWPSGDLIYPKAIRVKVISQATEVKGGMLDDEFNLPYDGAFKLNLPAGTYHLEIDFPNILDWDADPNPRG